MRTHLTLFALLLFSMVRGQDATKLAAMEQSVKTATTDAEKVAALAALAEYYQVYRLDKKADSILDQQISVAEFSRDKDMLLQALFTPVVSNLGTWTTTDIFEHAISLTNKSVEYAESLGRNDLVGLAYTRLAGLYRKRGNYNEALKQVNLAYSVLGNDKKDTVQLLLHIEAGDIYTALGEALPAFKNYSNALDISYAVDNISLRSEIYRHLADLFKSLNDEENAKKQLMKSVDLNLQSGNKNGLIRDYIDLARLTDDRQYIERAANLAMDMGSEKYLLYTKRLMFTWYMIKEKNARVTREYLDRNPDLTNYYKNQGLDNYYYTLGHIYKYSRDFDSSLFCFRCAEAELERSYDDLTRIQIMISLAETHLINSDSATATEYYMKAYTLANEKGLRAFLPGITDSLSILLAASGNYEKAYRMGMQAAKFKQEFSDKAAKDKLALIEVNNEIKAREFEDNRRHNLQYMAITLAIASIFLVLLLAGMFPITHLTIKIFGFMAFISLFEFFVLLIDKFLHDLTHGEPLKIWICKIAIIGMMVPFQHYLEHRMVHYLASRKLLRLRKNLVVNAFSRKKNPTPVAETEDTVQSQEKPTA